MAHLFVARTDLRLKMYWSPGTVRSSGRGPRGKAKAVLFSEAYAPRRILTSIRVTDIKQYVVVSAHSDSLARPLLRGEHGISEIFSLSVSFELFSAKKIGKVRNYKLFATTH